MEFPQLCFFFMLKKTEPPKILRCNVKNKKLHFTLYFYSSLCIKHEAWDRHWRDQGWSYPRIQSILKKDHTPHMPTFFLYVWTLFWKRGQSVLGTMHSGQGSCMLQLAVSACLLAPMPAAQILHSTHYFSLFFKNIF